mgnify:FL=1
MFHISDLVIVRGLTSEAGQKLNNQVAEITSNINKEDGRYDVIFRFDLESRRIKTNNLVRRPYDVMSSVIFHFANKGIGVELETTPGFEDNIYGTRGFASHPMGGVDGVLGTKTQHLAKEDKVQTAMELHGLEGKIHQSVPIPLENGAQSPPPLYKVSHGTIVYLINADQLRQMHQNSILHLRLVNNKNKNMNLLNMNTISAKVDRMLDIIETATNFEDIIQEFGILHNSIYVQGTPADRMETIRCLMPHFSTMCLHLTTPAWDLTESSEIICRARLVLIVFNMFVSFPTSRSKVQRSSGELPGAVVRIAALYPLAKSTGKETAYIVSAVFLIWGVVFMPLRKKNPKKEMKMHYAYTAQKDTARNAQLAATLEMIGRGQTSEERRLNLHHKSKNVLMVMKYMNMTTKKRYIEVCDERHDEKVALINQQMGETTVMTVVACSAENCGNVESVGFVSKVNVGNKEKFKSCQCKAKYCCKACQIWDWKFGGHKDECMKQKKKMVKKEKNKNKKSKKSKKKT